MSQSSTSAATFLCYVLGSGPMPRVTEAFRKAYGTSPEAVGLFAGMNDSWEGASINHVLFRRLRVAVERLPEEVQSAATGRPSPAIVLEAASSVSQPARIESFLLDNLLPALADQLDGVVAHPDRGHLYTGDPTRKELRDLPWNHLEGAPDPEADDWTDVL